MIQLAIIRHGHTAWNRAGKIQGRTDIPLDSDAVTELAKYHLPTQWSEAALVSSPLLRATQTAQLISGREPDIEPALIEMDWGDWEGRQNRDLYVDSESGFRHLEQWGWDYHAPEGESPADVWLRLKPWVYSLQQDTVAVCHIGVMRAILAHAHGWHFEGPVPFEIKRNRLYVIDVSNELEVATPAWLRLASDCSL